jgi:hypothetical protein
MTDRNGAISTTGVVFAAVGAAVQDYALQILGLLVTVLVHMWTERNKRAAAQQDDSELKRWRRKSRSQQHLIDSMQRRLDRAAAAGYREPWEAPVAITPPFPPGEACSDA